MLTVSHIASVALLASGAFAIPAPAPAAVPAAGSSSLRETTWNPPANLKPALDAVWKHEMSTYSPKPDPLAFKNYGYQQIIANKGKVNYCVRLDSRQNFDAATRKQIEAALQNGINQWGATLKGFDGWPYGNIPVKVVGWAANSKSQLPGLNEASEGKYYSDKDGERKPQCAEACGRFFHQDNNYSKCAGGAASHYDMSLWLTDGMQGGAGGDWGQRVGTTEFLSSAKRGSPTHIWLHEVGHTLALDDFYDWTPPGIKEFIMLAGASQVITEFDAWMARDWWRHLKPRISGLPAAGSASSSFEAPAAAAPVAAPAAPAAAPAAGPAPSGQNAQLNAALKSLLDRIRSRLTQL